MKKGSRKLVERGLFTVVRGNHKKGGCKVSSEGLARPKLRPILGETHWGSGKGTRFGGERPEKGDLAWGGLFSP